MAGEDWPATVAGSDGGFNTDILEVGEQLPRQRHELDQAAESLMAARPPARHAIGLSPRL